MLISFIVLIQVFYSGPVFKTRLAINIVVKDFPYFPNETVRTIPQITSQQLPHRLEFYY